ncbi:hypothetical protein SEA_ZOOMAN_350 [Microbacterium phage Zooman]|nr:hypothetical protein SEA_ZOOMAN_37 [Microbacterium phage Zooman]UDL16591.1 hypothetical protein SEA_ZOOMAN_350 [Microbacterium phage Zooman]
MVDSEMRESLRRFGWGEAGIASIEANEAAIAEGQRAKRRANRQKVSAPALDFGDWDA